MGVGSKNPLFGYDLVPLASYVVNFKSLGPKLWKFFTENDQISPVKYKSIDGGSGWTSHFDFLEVKSKMADDEVFVANKSFSSLYSSQLRS